MRISRGVGCSFGSCGCTLLLAVLVAGCLVQPGGNKPKKPSTNDIVELSFRACQARDAAVAEALESVAKRVEVGDLKYDSGLQAELTKSFLAGDATAEDKRLSAAMAAVIAPGKTFDPTATAKALRQLAEGRRRAAK